MDQELFEIINALNRQGCGVRSITPILEHSESYDAIGHTKKIRSIESLRGLATPSIQLGNGKFIPNFGSRYFTADFSYGLHIIIALANLLQIMCPTLHSVFGWYRSISDDVRHFELHTLEPIFETH